MPKVRVRANVFKVGPPNTASMVVTMPVATEVMMVRDRVSLMELLTSTYIIKRAIEELPPPARNKGIVGPMMNGVSYVRRLRICVLCCCRNYPKALGGVGLLCNFLA